MAETITMPKLGFDMQEGTLVRWVRNEGETINKGDVLAEIETDKATVEVESSASGTVRKLLVEAGAVVPIGAAIAIVGAKDEKIEVPAKAESIPAPRTAQAPAARSSAQQQPALKARLTPVTDNSLVSTVEAVSVMGSVKASPLAKKIAREAQVDLKHVQGSGPAGRIVRKDIEAALAAGAQAALVQPAARRFPIPSATNLRPEDEKIALSRLRQAIARRMAESKTTVPHFYVTHEYKVEALLDLRDQANSVLPEDQKISVNDFVIKSAALCLREFPNLNAAYQGENVLRHGAINIGVAVAVEGGLLTVVCKDADQKNLREISNEVKAMAARARSGKVHPEDIEGSTFSVSNLGMFDVENFAAILNPPEAGILAVASAREVPVVEKGAIKPGWRMKATLAVDHRVSDGAEAAQFMRALAKYIEVPLSLFL
jgi:pyruvate dehydrogenase E2 component (dihydrolipoamide acetyltransferase)